jgi:hypothetical protein
VGGEHGSSPGVGLAEEGVADSCPVEAEVESADTGEEASGIHVTTLTVRPQQTQRPSTTGAGWMRHGFTLQ